MRQFPEKLLHYADKAYDSAVGLARDLRQQIATFPTGSCRGSRTHA